MPMQMQTPSQVHGHIPAMQGFTGQYAAMASSDPTDFSSMTMPGTGALPNPPSTSVSDKNARTTKKPTKAPQRSVEPAEEGHPHHLGKIPSRKKRVRGRPPKSDRSQVRRTSSKSQRKPAPPSSLSIQLVSDLDPSRIVNPLLEFPSQATQSEPIHGSELITLTNLVFYRPDTYPLSYLGRLLGFHIPIPAMEGGTRPVFPTPFPDVNTLPLLKKSPAEDFAFHVPQEQLPLPPHWNRKLSSSSLGDRDDQCTLDYIDPVYAHFLQRGWDKTRCRAGTSALLAKLAIPHRETIRASVLDLAQSLQIYNANHWTFAEWAPSTGLYRPQWTLDDQKAYTAPPTQSFGVVASFQGEPVALMHYKFLWYPMMDKMEAELIMVLEGLVLRSGTEVVTPTNDTPTGTTLPVDTPTPSTDLPIPQGGPVDSVEGVPTQRSEASQPPLPPIPKVEIDENIHLILVTLALEHARAADVWYCLWNTPRHAVEIYRDCFRMVPLSTGRDPVPMIADLKKCNSRYALLKRKEMIQGIQRPRAVEENLDHRVLVKLPLMEEARSYFDAPFAEAQRSKRASTTNAFSRDFTGATGKPKDTFVAIRATLLPTKPNPSVKIHVLDENGEICNDDELVLKDVVQGQHLAQLDILKQFPLPAEESDDTEDNEIVKQLLAKQQLLLETETSLEPRLRDIMSKLIIERMEYEKPEAQEQRAEERQIMKRMEEYLARRKELDLAREEQRELDMNAVCNICNDGEVTPDNQILFCEACDVPIHQRCYGIDEIPEGDYYCVACRHFNREVMSREPDRLSSTGARIALPALPIRCELCPVKSGAYIRTDTSKSDPKSTVPKWVHMVCAKWQGLNFVEKDKPDLVEDVSELKKYFRRMNVRCAVCLGQRGAYHQCRHDGCDKYLHITCARAIGVCEVIHGENVDGPVTTNPWTLMCPEHSNVDPEEVSNELVPVEDLMAMAKELPDDPMPEPPPEPLKPFNKLTGKERRRALADLEYEKQFMDELLTKRFAGLRCEVCWALEDDGKGLARCTDCESVICCSCRYSDQGEVNPEQKQFRCFSCRYVRDKTKANEPFEPPKCHLCNQNYGLLLESYANPVNRLSHWKNNEKEFKRSIFARKLWTHYSCAFWVESLEIQGATCQVNCSNVVMSSGMGYVRAKSKCVLCGLHTGLKARCSDPNCRARGEKRSPYWMHVTCARQAGYEVQHEDDHEPPFYVKCYYHGGCEYNLRARLEDLIETEKRRSGKNYSRAEASMSFSDGSRLLNHAITVVRMLGWAWRWAEQWVEWGSNWEPLLDPGEKEENMTKEQLKIVDSTPESRAEDARRCRLAAFGAALRNRAYDTEEGFDNESLGQALNAILHTKSLVGPLNPYEIEFCVEWLSRAYRSKSKFLGLGEHKIKVATDDFCAHRSDKSPKYELGNRPLPGKSALEPGQIFESRVEEPDDFLLPEVFLDGSKCSLPPHCQQSVPKKVIKYKKAKGGDEEESSTESDEVKKSLDDLQNSDAGQSSQKPSKKSIGGDETSSKKRKRQRNSDEASLMPSRAANVAAMVPSAVKKRGLERATTPTVWTSSTDSPQLEMMPAVPQIKKIKRKRAHALTAIIENQDLTDRNSADSVLRRARRGRPPRVMELVIVLMVEGQVYRPKKAIAQREKVDSEAGQETQHLSGQDEMTGDSSIERPSMEPKNDKDLAHDKSATGTSPSKARDTTTIDDGKNDFGDEAAKTADHGSHTGDTTTHHGTSGENTAAHPGTTEENTAVHPGTTGENTTAHPGTIGGNTATHPDTIGENTATHPDTTEEITTAHPGTKGEENTPEASDAADPTSQGDGKVEDKTYTERASHEPIPSLDDTDDEAIQPPRKRKRSQSDKSVRQGGERKRRAVLHVHVPENTSSAREDSSDSDSESDEPGYRAKRTRPTASALRTRKRASNSEGKSDLSSETPADGMRRSSRHSSAREKSLKEPDDNFTDSEEIEVVDKRKERKRLSRGWV